MAWLERIPEPVMEACMAMLPTLLAEEDVRRSNATAMGSGTLAAAQRDEIARAWQTALEPKGDALGQVRKPDLTALAAHGFQALRVPYRPPERA